MFVAHNVRYDWGFVAAELLRARNQLLVGPRLCTVKLARRLFPHLTSRSLDAITYALGIEIGSRHRAGGDARATARVLQRLVAMAQERGAVTLADLGGMRKAEGRMQNRRPSIHSAFSIPHSALGS